MQERIVAGTVPQLPGRWNQSSCWQFFLPAERLAAARIYLGLLFVLDLVWLYAPLMRTFYGPGSLSDGVFLDALKHPYWSWSLFEIPFFDQNPKLLLVGGILSGLMLAAGILPNLTAGCAWLISVSLFTRNPSIHNGGDIIRNCLLFVFMFSPLNSAWCVGKKLPRAKVHAWWFYLICLQMCLVYFLNGVRKIVGEDWQTGLVMYYICQNDFWAQWPVPKLPVIFYKLGSWFTLVWEIGFPLFLLMPWSRTWILWTAFIFHIFTYFHLEVGLFPFYCMPFYIFFVPWERLVSADTNRTIVTEDK